MFLESEKVTYMITIIIYTYICTYLIRQLRLLRCFGVTNIYDVFFIYIINTQQCCADFMGNTVYMYKYR